MKRIALLSFGASLFCAAMAATSVAQTQSQPSQSEPKQDESLSPTGRQGVKASESTTVRATVEAVDPATRTVTLRGESGKTVEVKCGDEIRNFDQIKKGDQLTMKYYQSVALALRKTDEAPSVEEKRGMTRSEPGHKPGGMAYKTVQLSATIEGIDRATREVTLRGPQGNTKTIKVGDEVKNFDRLKEGDQVVATMTEALAINVMKPSQ